MLHRLRWLVPVLLLLGTVRLWANPTIADNGTGPLVCASCAIGGTTTTSTSTSTSSTTTTSTSSTTTTSTSTTSTSTTSTTSTSTSTTTSTSTSSTSTTAATTSTSTTTTTSTSTSSTTTTSTSSTSTTSTSTSSTSTTSTSTSTTTTTSTTLASWSDNFNRTNENPMGGNWTQTTFDGSGQVQLFSAATYTTTNGNGAGAMWSPNTPDAGSNYACALVVGGPSGVTGACTGMSQANGDMVCCTIFGAKMRMVVYDGGTGSYFADYTSAAFSLESGDYIAIVRTSATAFTCYYCDTSATGCNDATDWVAQATETVNNITNPGLTGLYSESTVWGLDAWGAGNGTSLPIPNQCASNGVTTTSTSTSSTTSTSSSTTTSTSSTTTTTVVVNSWSDNFNRTNETPISGGGWEQATYDGSTDMDLISNGAVTHTHGNGAGINWTTNTPDAGSNYSCALLTVGSSQGAGACTGSSNANGDTACCVTFGASVHLIYYDNNTGHDYITYSGAVNSITGGDYVAIVRSSSTDFRCYWCDTSASGCNEASDWNALGTGIETIPATITNPGLTGAYSESTAWVIDSWGGGNGTSLPAPNVCAP